LRLRGRSVPARPTGTSQVEQSYVEQSYIEQSYVEQSYVEQSQVQPALQVCRASAPHGRAPDTEYRHDLCFGNPAIQT
jgi:hypothetical protein